MATKETFNTLIFPISVQFYPGEQPQAGKLTGLAQETESGIESISDALGDLQGNNVDVNKLFYHVDRPASVTTVARALGPMSMLSALRPVATTFTAQATIPAGVNEIQLPYPPFVIDLGSNEEQMSVDIDTATGGNHIQTVLNTYDSNAFGTMVSSLAAVDALGKYYIDLNGKITTYTKTKDPATTGPTYQFQLYPDAYPRAGLNVIPDFNQITGLCTVNDSEDDYDILSLPMITESQLVNSSGNSIGPGELSGVVPPASYQATLPKWLTDSYGMDLVAGEEIPLGFIQIWNDDDGVVTGITQILLDNANRQSIRVYPKERIVASKTYRVVVPSATLAETLAFQKERYDFHDHSERKHGKAISHNNLSNNRIEPSEVNLKYSIILHGSPASLVAGNTHPQYASRYGYKANSDPGNQDGAILGDMFLATKQPSGYNTINYDDGGADSSKLYFGTTSNHIYFKNGEGLLLTSTMVKTSGDFTIGQAGSVLGTLGVTGRITSSAGIDITTGGISVGGDVGLTGSITKTGSLTIDATTGTVISNGLTVNNNQITAAIGLDVTSGPSLRNTGISNCKALTGVTGVSCVGTISATILQGNLDAGYITSSPWVTTTTYGGHTSDDGAHNATSSPTANKIVRRDGSGNFSAGTITGTFVGSLSGGAVNCTSVTTSGQIYTSNTVHCSYIVCDGNLDVNGGTIYLDEGQPIYWYYGGTLLGGLWMYVSGSSSEFMFQHRDATGTMHTHKLTLP